MGSTAIAASRKRKLLAAYVDLLLFLIVWGPANFVVGGHAHFVGGLVVFVVLRLLTWKLKAAPGLYFLGICTTQYDYPALDPSDERPVAPSV